MMRFGIVLLTGLLSLFACFNATAQTEVVQVQNQPVIVTTVPAPKEQIVIPQGYVSCFQVPAGWSANNVWVPERKVCQYIPGTAAVQGAAWVDSYWACTQYKPTPAKPTESDCTTWEWRPGHWVKTLEVY